MEIGKGAVVLETPTLVEGFLKRPLDYLSRRPLAQPWGRQQLTGIHARSGDTRGALGGRGDREEVRHLQATPGVARRYNMGESLATS